MLEAGSGGRAGSAWLRPPGTVTERYLLDHCERCGKCVAACPASCIEPLPPDRGEAAGTPAIHPSLKACVLCEGLACTHACPSGALLPLFSPSDVRMGTARLDPALCVTYAGQACDVCVSTCPMPGALARDAGGRVWVVENLCVGCGVCEQMCPTLPRAVRVLAPP